MSTRHWINGKQASYGDPTAYAEGVAPGDGDTVVISSAGDGAPTRMPGVAGFNNSYILLPTNTSSLAGLYTGSLFSEYTTTDPVTGLISFNTYAPNLVQAGLTIANQTLDLIGAGSETALFLQNSTLASSTTVNVSGAAYAYAGYTNLLAGTINIGLPLSVDGQPVPTAPADANGATSDLSLDVQDWGSWAGASLSNYIPTSTNTGIINIGAGALFDVNLAGHDASVSPLTSPVQVFVPPSRSEFANTGTINVLAGGILLINSPLDRGLTVNDGTISINGAQNATTGAIFAGGTLSGNGEILVSGGTATDPGATSVLFRDTVLGQEIVISDATVNVNPNLEQASDGSTPFVYNTYSGGSFVFADSKGRLNLTDNTFNNGQGPFAKGFTDTISGFRAGDTITIGTLLPDVGSGGNNYAFSGGWDPASHLLQIYLSGNSPLGNFTELVASLTLEGNYANTDFQLPTSLQTWDGKSADPAFVTLTTTNTLSGPQTYTLTAAPAAIVGGASNDSFIATASTLVAGDRLDGGGGGNTLVLSGAGQFDLTLPVQLANIQTLHAGEAAVSQQQVVDLRAGLDLTVNVAAAPAGASNPGITIYGAANHDVINLGPGSDTVYLGAGEILHAGGGNDIIGVTAASLSDTIDGGTGHSTLQVSGGGTLSMGAGITRIAQVQLQAAPTGTTQAPYIFTANSIAGLAIRGSGGADTIRLGAASQSVNALGGAVHVLATAAQAGAAITGAAGAVLEITSGGKAVLNAATTDVTVHLDVAAKLTLNAMSFITAIGSSGNDTIRAGGAGQTLEGGGGKDTLVGSAAFGDMFKDIAAHFGLDKIMNFGGTDKLDIVDLAYNSGTSLTYTPTTGGGLLKIFDGAQGTTIHVTGTGLSTSSFTLSSDGAAGVFVGLH